MDAAKHATITWNLHGSDLAPVLQKGAEAAGNEERSESLSCFTLFAYLDSELLLKVQAFLNGGGD